MQVRPPHTTADDAVASMEQILDSLEIEQLRLHLQQVVLNLQGGGDATSMEEWAKETVEIRRRIEVLKARGAARRRPGDDRQTEENIHV